MTPCLRSTGIRPNNWKCVNFLPNLEYWNIHIFFFIVKSILSFWFFIAFCQCYATSDQINIVSFWYLAKSDLFSVRYFTREHWTLTNIRSTLHGHVWLVTLYWIWIFYMRSRDTQLVNLVSGAADIRWSLAAEDKAREPQHILKLSNQVREGAIFFIMALPLRP